MTPPFVLVDASADDVGRLGAERARLAGQGWHVVDGLDTRPALVRAVLAGPVTTPPDASSALLAALDGFGLLLLVACDPPTRDRLVDDLRRLGDVRQVEAAAPGAVGDTGPLSAEGRAILALLAEGFTLGEAANELALSRRTADRRLAEARAALGVTRTTEAIALAARKGLLGRD